MRADFPADPDYMLNAVKLMLPHNSCIRRILAAQLLLHAPVRDRRFQFMYTYMNANATSSWKCSQTCLPDLFEMSRCCSGLTKFTHHIFQWPMPCRGFPTAALSRVCGCRNCPTSQCQRIQDSVLRALFWRDMIAAYCADAFPAAVVCLKSAADEARHATKDADYAEEHHGNGNILHNAAEV